MPAKLPQFQGGDTSFQLMQNRWASLIEPTLSNPLVQGQLLTNVTIVAGSNVVNHKLSRPLVGWLVVRQRALASLFDTQDSNTRPALTLLLTSSADVMVDLYVF